MFSIASSKLDARLTDGFDEWIQVHTNQIDQGKLMLLNLLHVFRVVADGEQTSGNPRIQCFHAAIKNFREAGQIGDLTNRDAVRREEP